MKENPQYQARRYECHNPQEEYIDASRPLLGGEATKRKFYDSWPNIKKFGTSKAPTPPMIKRYKCREDHYARDYLDD